jgi:glucose-6-phosphate-specific signal transduction histidine kinase
MNHLFVIFKYFFIGIILFLMAATSIPFFKLGIPLAIAFVVVWYFYGFLRALLAVMILGVMMSVQMWNESNPGDDTVKTSQTIGK